VSKKQAIDSRQLISFDWAIKRLLRRKADFAVLEGFLEALFERKMTVVELLESETNKDADEEKQLVVDVLCKTDEGELLLIEIQFYHETDYFQRMLFGASKVLTEHLKQGEEYAKVVKLYSVNLVYFDLGQGDDYVYHGKTTFTGIHTQNKLQLSETQKRKFDKSVPEDIFPEYYILKINNFNDVAKTPLDEWIYYLKNEKLPQECSTKTLTLLSEELKLRNMNVEELQAYKKYRKYAFVSKSAIQSAYEEGEFKGIEKGIEKGIKQGIEQGIEKGIERGMNKNKIQTVVNAYKEGASIAFIAKILSITEQEVQQILNENLLT
jgi:predicted transposase/invertase (TIGR01784 family)